MPKEIKTEILIYATPEKVWSILTDFDDYPNWNPFIRSVTGQVKPGSTITARLKPPKASGMTIKPRVIAFETNRELCWRGHLLIPGLFDGEHSFVLHDNGNNTTTLKHSEQFNGLLVPLFRKMLDVNTTNGFHQMNRKLKEMAEQY